MAEHAPEPSDVFQTHPARYRHWRLTCENEIATLTLAVQPAQGLRPGYELKLNSFDLAVDVELADAVQRLVFEHPEVRCVVLTGAAAAERVFSAGANIGMLATSSKPHTANFRRFTNETRLTIEDLSASGGVRFLAALNGTAAGGGYELALACDRILLVDDHSSAVSLPEVPVLGVIPGAGGILRMMEKRKLRRDRADVVCTLAEGIKGKRALEWGLVDALVPTSRWSDEVARHARELAGQAERRDGPGVELLPIRFEREDGRWSYRYVELAFERELRVARLTLRLPADAGPREAQAARAAGSRWWFFQAFRELDHALLGLRFLEPEIGLVLVRVEGTPEVALATDEVLLASRGDWFVDEVVHFVKRTLKHVESTTRSFYAVADEGSAFVGTFLELLLACDRSYVRKDAGAAPLGTSGVHAGLYPTASGLTRLEARFLAEPERVQRVLEPGGRLFGAAEADELGLVTFAPDELDWEDELRLAIEERASFSPDALTGMEQNVRPAGPETLEAKILGRLTAWQDWIFERPNAAGEKGSLKRYGSPQRPEYDYRRI